jgi:predicted O-linked N-acetylglucosamine transferase (SPINDLY family)
MSKMTITELFSEAGRLETTGEIAKAVSLYESWIALHASDPHLHAALFNFAVVQGRAGNKFAAINTLRQAIRLKPDFQPPYINLGRMLEDVGQGGEAVTQWMSLVNQLGTVNGESMKHKLMALQQMGRVLENGHIDGPAEDALRMSLELNPHQPEVGQHWIALRQKQCKWPVFETSEFTPKAAVLANISPLSNAVMLDDPVFQLARAASYAKSSIAIPSAPAPDHEARKGARPQKLKIGYVSSDLREHAVGFGLSEVMEIHDRQRFEIHAYYCGIDREDATKARIRGAVDHWTDINGMSDDAAAQHIMAAGIDILVDVNGYTRDARTAVFARCPAPVQVNWYGFPGTMGTPYHHYVIADPYVVPDGSEIFFSEKVLRMPCYQPNDRKRKVAAQTPSRAAENLPDEGFVFCCLNGSQKITEPVFEAWMRILEGVPGSTLWLLDTIPSTNERLRQMAAARGIDPVRLRFAPKRPNPQHLARYPLAGLFLDTFPYGAHTTASDALWMGTPVLTMAGRTFAARVCAGLVTAAGLPELVMPDIDSYVARAIAIASDAQLAAGLRTRIEQKRAASLLFNTDSLVAGLEGLYDIMWSDFATGHLPVPDLRNLSVYEEIAIKLHSTGADFAIEDYQRHLATLHGYAPLWPDNRLWQQPAAELVPMTQPRKPQRLTSTELTPDVAWLKRA